MFELKVMEPAAFKFDYIATQAGQSSAGMPENDCRTRRREEAESFSKKLMKVTSVAWQPHATLHATLHAALHATLHATLPNLEAHESDQCCVAAPRNTTRYTTRNTTRYTTRNTTEWWQGQHFGALMLLRNEMKIQDAFSVLARNAAPGSISALLRVV